MGYNYICSLLYSIICILGLYLFNFLPLIRGKWLRRLLNTLLSSWPLFAQVTSCYYLQPPVTGGQKIMHETYITINLL